MSSVLEPLAEDEKYLWAIISDESGLDLAELVLVDEQQEDRCFRAWPFQWPWWRNNDVQQIDLGSRCVSEGTPILTSTGWKQIETVSVGDKVLTHKNRWRTVLDVYDNGFRNVVGIKSQGMVGELILTPDHQLLARHANRGSISKHGTRGKVFDDTDWISMDEWRWNNKSQIITTHCASPADKVQTLPEEWRFVERAYKSGRQNYIEDTFNLDWLWLYGLYIAEGYSFKNNVHAKAKWCLHKDEIDLVLKVFDKLGLSYSVGNSKDNGRNLQLNSRPMVDWLRANTGRYSWEKYIAPWVLGLPRDARQAVFDGVTFGDGWTRSSGRIDYSTTSKKLALDLRILAQSLGYSFSVSVIPAKTGMIEGREINCREKYACGIESLANRKGSNVTIDDGSVWMAVKSMTPVDTPVHTWDLEVDEDHSFIANGLILHNSSGKSMSIRLRAFVFPFIHPQQTLVVTAPEGTHIQTITNEIEKIYSNNRLPNEMLKKGPGGIKHKPFEINFQNGATIMGVIPQRTGAGLKGCVGEGTLILTEDRGYVPVETLTVGDMVLTQENRWRPLKALRTGENECFEVKAQGIHPLIVSHDHRFYGLANISGAKQANRFDFPGWYGVQHLLEDNVFLASQTEFPETTIPRPVFNGTAISFETNDDDFWWLVGRYLADGYLSTEKKTGRGHRVCWVVTPWQHDEITSRLTKLGLHSHIKERDFSSADIVSVSSAPLNRWLNENFGQLSDGKKLPTFSLGMKREYRQALLAGYLSGDSYFDEGRQRYTVGSASKTLVVGVQMLAQSLGHYVNCSHTDPKTKSINGVKLKSTPKRSWKIQISDRTRKGFYEGYHLGRIKSVESVGLRKVYNPIVEEDHSYVSESCISHNLHPLWLEVDEAQDFPPLAWNEIIETLQQGTSDARWRCIAGGQLVLTFGGWKPIEEVQIGDKVMTHKQRWRTVTSVWDNGIQDCVEVKGNGPVSLVMTSNHKLWTRESRRIKDHKVLLDPVWKTLEDFLLTKSQTYWCTYKGNYVFDDLWYSGDDLVWSPIVSVQAAGAKQVYDLTVEEDHSYIVEGQVVSNCHGVTRGVQDKFYEFTKPDSGWKVHHYPAMYRPTWTAKERETKIKLYGGSAEDPDFRRNVYGTHGDATSVLFVLYRLLTCGLGSTPVTVYNQGELQYKSLDSVSIGDEVVNATGKGLVHNVSTSEHDSIVHIRVGGESLYFSPEHPFFTQRGWVFAGGLTSEDYLLNPSGVRDLWGKLSTKEGGKDCEVLLQRMLEAEGVLAEESLPDLSNRISWKQRENMLLSSVFGNNEETAESESFNRMSDVRGEHSWRQGYLPVLQPKVLARVADSECTSGGMPGVSTGVFGPERSEVLLASLFWQSDRQGPCEDGALKSDHKDLSILQDAVLSSVQRSQVLFDPVLPQGPMEKLHTTEAKLSRLPREFPSRQKGAEVLFDGLLEKLSKGSPQNQEGEEDQERVWGATPSSVGSMATTWRQRGGLGTGVLDQSDGGLGSQDCLLQTRHSESYDEGERGTRRLGAYDRADSVQGQTEGRVAGATRVESVEVYLSGSEGFARLSDGKDTITLYNLTVSGHPSFFAGKGRFLTHNCVDRDEESFYNTEEYAIREISVGMVKEAGNIINLLDVPSTHKQNYDNFWMGMDVGYTTDPSVIVIFGEEPPEKRGGPKRLKLLMKVILKQITNPDQAACIMHLMEEYMPKAFAMDSTGAGLPLFQDIQFMVREDPNLKRYLDRIKGYNFSSKIVVDIDDTVKYDEYSRENPDAEIKRNVLEHSTDILRGMVDDKSLHLPWDPALIEEFRGQTYTFSKSAPSSEEHSRRRVFSKGFFHSLDACRMAALGFSQHLIDAKLAERENKFVAVPTIFLS